MAGKRITTEEIYESNLGALKGAVTDPDLWAQWLATVGNHPKESALNCAAIMASPYEDTRELRNAEGWARFGGSIKEGEPGIPTVHRSKAGHLFCDILYPASAVEGADEKRYRGLPPQIDLEDEIDGPAYLAACKKWGEDIAQAGDTAMYAVNARYGIPNDTVPELPSTVLLEDAKALNEYCRAIKNEAEGLIFRLDATIKAERRNAISPVVASAQGEKREVAIKDPLAPATERQLDLIADLRAAGVVSDEDVATLGDNPTKQDASTLIGMYKDDPGFERVQEARRAAREAAVKDPLAPATAREAAAEKDVAPQPVRDAPSPSPERNSSSMNDAARAFAKVASANSAHGAAESQGVLQM